MYTLREIQQETEQIEKYLEIVRAPARTALCVLAQSASRLLRCFRSGSARALLLLRRCCTR